MTEGDHANDGGWGSLARFLGVSRRTLYRRRAELLEAGVIHYRIKKMPNGGKQRIMYWFPRVIQAYYIKKASKKEEF